MGAFRKILAKLMDQGMPEFQDKPGEETSPEDKKKAREYVVRRISGEDEEKLSPEEIERRKKEKERQITWEN